MRTCNTPGIATLIVFKLGTIIRKGFAIGQFHKGEVTAYDPVNHYYKIKYRDGNSEDFDHHQLQGQYKRKQQYSTNAKLLVPPWTSPMPGIPIPKQSRKIKLALSTQRQPRYVTLSPLTQRYKLAATALFLQWFFGASGTICDETLNKMAAYRDLVKHPDQIICQRWLMSGGNKFGRLFLQGYSTTEGMDVLD